MGFYKNIKSIVRLDDKSNFNYTPHIDEVVRIPGQSGLYICTEYDPELSVMQSTTRHQCRRCSCGGGGKPCFQCGSDEREDGKDVVLRPVEESNSHQTQLSLLLVNY